MIRIGHGFDVHRFGGEGPIIIGGVKIPYEQGLIAHSDGDVALHALSDALLGAIAAGDIGRHFPDTDDKWKGADSRELLKDVYRRVKAQGYVLGNADVTIIAQAPKMALIFRRCARRLPKIWKPIWQHQCQSDHDRKTRLYRT